MAANKILSAFTPRKSTHKGVGDFDTHYVNYEVKKVVKKIGEGEDDYVLVTKIIEHKDSIKGVIESHADEVGVYNLIERAIRTGDMSLLNRAAVSDTEQIVDTVGMPTTPDEALHYAESQVDKYNALPDEIKKGRTFEQFLASTTTADDFAAWVKSLVPEADKKEEVKE